MSNGINWIELLVSWGPMLLLIAVWIYFMQRYHGLTKSGMTQMQYLEALLEETKRHNQQLEKLIERLAERNDRTNRKP